VSDANPARFSPLLEKLYEEDGASVAELREPGDAALLYPEEAECCHGFAAVRRAEFAAGRLCARRALSELGYTAFPLLVNSDRTPRWPAGVVGSISHTNGFCGAVVAETNRFRGIGVDVEIAGRVTPDMWPELFTDGERAVLERLTPEARTAVAAIAFSAKESFYKCQFPATGSWVDFHDVLVSLQGDATRAGSFTVHSARGKRALTMLPLRGRFCIQGEFVATGIAMGT